MQTADNTPSEKDIDRLVKKSVKGDTVAFGELYDHFLDLIYRHIYYRVGNTSDAEDLTQQVFLKAWQAIGRYRKKSAFGAWLMTISRNLIIDFYRARKEKESLDDRYEAASKDPGPAQVAEATDEQQRLLRVIARLPEEQRQIIIMKFIEGYGYPEIAGLLGKKEGAVRVIQHRALKKLREFLDEEAER